MHIMFRWETRMSDDQICHNLFGHPSIIKLPNHLPGHSLHDALLRIVPSWNTMKNYTVVLTNSKVVNLYLYLTYSLTNHKLLFCLIVICHHFNCEFIFIFFNF